MRILAADIGGTKTLLRLVELGAGGGTRVLCERRYESARFDGFSAVLAQFLAEARCAGAEIESACFAVAGPVRCGAGVQNARVTNLPWQLDSGSLAREFSFGRVQLINDFQAVGYGIDTLDAQDLVTLQAGAPLPGAPQLVVGAGTGLGVAQRIREGGRYRVLPSEGGHVDFAPLDALQDRLLAGLRGELGHVSVERLCSGDGLARIYRHLCRERPAETSAAVARAMAQGDPAAAVADFAQRHCDPLAGAALEIFVAIYGAQVGNLALIVLPRGGVYIAGGIAPKILGSMTGGGFIGAFRAKGRMTTLLDAMPIAVVTNPQVGLQGAAWAATLED